jgi:hypothetical protein
MSDDIYIKWPDIRRVYQCRPGVKKFLTRHNLSYQEFLTRGISAKTLLDTGDAMAADVVEAAKRGVGR